MASGESPAQLPTIGADFNITEKTPTQATTSAHYARNAPTSDDAVEQIQSWTANGQPLCLLVLGMAGSGKTTFVTALSDHLRSSAIESYLINMDPACNDTPYAANVDIRDSIKYKDLMKRHHLGPNGAIVTSLNLFATKLPSLIQLLEQRKRRFPVMLFDTPGQIEVFTWSASGSIIAESLAKSFPTVILYVLDTESASSSPVTFTSNMLYACSILYRMKLPFVIAMNKADLGGAAKTQAWMDNFEQLIEALDHDDGYAACLSRSLVLALDEFYECIKCVKVSSSTGEGMSELATTLVQAVGEYHKDYKPKRELKRSSAEGEQDRKLEELRKKLEIGQL